MTEQQCTEFTEEQISSIASYMCSNPDQQKEIEEMESGLTTIINELIVHIPKCQHCKSLYSSYLNAINKIADHFSNKGLRGRISLAQYPTNLN